MAASAGRTGTYATGHGPPRKVFLGLAVALFVLNHLSVVLGNGLMPEALAMGCWLGLMGGWVLLAGRSFEAVWGWARPYARRELGLALLTFAVALAVAEVVAWWGYGQHLFG